jgi:hypothetical protein
MQKDLWNLQEMLHVQTIVSRSTGYFFSAYGSTKQVFSVKFWGRIDQNVYNLIGINREW